jgi:CheY-like chemotaxis protein
VAKKERHGREIPIDLPSVMERIGGDESFLEELINIYIEDFLTKYDLLRKAIKQRDFKAIQEIGHSLKGSSGNLSLNGLHEISSELEISGKERDIEQTESYLCRLSDEFKKLQDFLPQHSPHRKQHPFTASSGALHSSQIEILAADDSVPNQILLKYCAAQAGFDIDIVSNGREAVEYFQKKPYSIVFLDIHMPEVDGFEALNLMRKIEYEDILPRTPIIALTGSTFQEKGTICLDAGFDDFVEKSSFQSELSEIMNKHVRKENVRTKKIEMEKILLPLIPEYLQNRKKDVKKIKEALEKKNFNEIEDLGHKMKGSGKCYGFEKISTLGHQIEISAKERRTQEIKRSIDQMQDYLAHLIYE